MVKIPRLDKYNSQEPLKKTKQNKIKNRFKYKTKKNIH